MILAMSVLHFSLICDQLLWVSFFTLLIVIEMESVFQPGTEINFEKRDLTLEYACTKNVASFFGTIRCPFNWIEKGALRAHLTYTI